METSPRIAAILTVFNRRDLTLACLRAIEAQQASADARIEVFLTDDASTDGTAEAVAREFPDVHLLEGDGSLFWNGGMRQSFAAAQARDFDYYLWLNDDTEMDEGAIARLIATHRGLAAARPEPVIVVGTTRDPDTGTLTYGGQMRKSAAQPLRFLVATPMPDRPRQVDTMNGNCVLIPRNVVQRLGNIAPHYIQKMGDFDYGFRAVHAGCTVWVAPGTIGTCAAHPPRRTDQQPLADEIRRLSSIKELPPRPWATFCRRWAGPLWPLFFASPYLKRGAALVAQRLRPVVTRES